MDIVISLIESNISERPKNKKEIAGTLISLLKTKEKNKLYVQNCLFAVATLEEFLGGLEGQIRNTVKKLHLYFPILEKTAAAAILFAALNNEESGRLEEYLYSLIPEVPDSLEKYMSKNLSAGSEPRCLESFPESGYESIFPMRKSKAYEDFKITGNAFFFESQIEKLILAYYQERRYDTVKSSPLMFMATKRGEFFGIKAAVLGKDILVTVRRFK